ncbi:MAG: hypothetical protein OEV94_05950 [Deltaproteobacteria bacterium]|nr:hypothetical protein [Deltaproteobacteria bacterium]
MQLFIDIDGVILNFERTFVRFLNQEYQVGLPEDYQTDTFEFDQVLKPNNIEDAWWRFLESDMAGDLSPMVDVERLNRLAARHTVHLLTNFPEREMAKRADNLARLGLKYHSLHHCGFHQFTAEPPLTKGQMVTQLLQQEAKGLFIDDHPNNCLDVKTHCPDLEVWLMTQRFNRDFSHPEVRRAVDWGCLYARLEEIHREQAA